MVFSVNKGPFRSLTSTRIINSPFLGVCGIFHPQSCIGRICSFSVFSAGSRARSPFVF
jgi:hypothetical protein